MRTYLTFFALLASGLADTSVPKLPRVFLGDTSHPVVYGEVWLVENGWGQYPGIRVAAIRDGRMEPDLSIEYPECSADGQACVLAVGVADKPPAGPELTEAGTAYGTGPSELSQRFPLWYLSARIEEAEDPAGWAPALLAMGRAESDGVILPKPEKRTVRLLDPDGRPHAKALARVALFGANNNHCGAAVGFPLGEFVSDAKGQFTLTSTRGPLALSLPHFVEQSGGPAGTAYAPRNDIVTGPDTEITIKRLWTLPEREYTVTVRLAGGAPLAGVRLNGCLWDPPCGAPCGPVGGTAATDSAGVARFRDRDLRSLRNLSLTDSSGKMMYLNLAELRELLTTGRVSVEWRELPRLPQIPPREP